MKKLQLIIFLFLSYTFTSAQINADFSILPCGGLSVNFIDQSTSNGNITDWEWDFGDGNTSQWQNPSHIYTIPFTYTVCLNIADDLGQMDTICMPITVSNSSGPVCIIDPNIPTLSCAGGNSTATLDGSQSSSGPNFTYQWFTQNGNILFGTENVPNPIIGATGFYTLSVTDITTGCSASSTVEVLGDSDFPVANVIVSNILSCSNNTVTLNGSNSSPSPDFTYRWSLGNMTISTDNTIDVSFAGTYELQVTNASMPWCSVSNFVEVINDGSVPSINLPVTEIQDTIVNCMEVVQLSADLIDSNCTNCSVEIRDQNDSLICNSLPCNVDFNVLGFFPNNPLTILVTDNDLGCSSSAILPAAPNVGMVSSSNITDESCTGTNDGSIIISVGGTTSPFTFDWFDLPGTDNPLERTNLSAGIYTLQITDIVGCTYPPKDYEVESSSIAIDAVINDVSCWGEADGSIVLTPTGSGQPYTFIWSPNIGNSQSVTNLSAGTYTVNVVDINGCSYEESFVVNQPAPLEISNIIINNSSCNGAADGSINLSIIGGTPPYGFSWSNNSNAQNLTGLIAGTYTVTITDVNSCFIVSPQYEVSEDICFSLVNDTTICEGDLIQLSNDTPTAGYTYEWSPTVGLNDPNISNPIAAPFATTIYTINILDGTGSIIFTDLIQVNVQSYLDFGLLDFSNAPICEDDPLELYGNLGTSFLWSGPNGFQSTEENPVIPNALGTQSGIYSLTITDDFGCTASADVDVLIDDDCVWPGDTDTNMVVNNFDLLNIGLAFDSMGTTRENASLNWMGQPSIDWAQSTPNSNVNFKHTDTDGNGIVNADDTLAITQNFGLTHNFNGDILTQFTDLPPVTDGGVLNAPFYIEPDTLIEGETVALDIILGEMSNVVTGLYGIAFTIEYDSAVVVPNTASIDFSNSWLGNINADAISLQFDFHSPGKIEAAITRIDGIEMDGFGLFGEFIITLEDDILLWGPNSTNFTGGTTTDVFTDFKITNYQLINFSQEEILVDGLTTSALIDGTTSLTQIELNQLIEIYPNPTNELFFIAAKDIEIESVRIFSATGELKNNTFTNGDVLEFSTKELPNGIYFIEIQTEDGRVTKKLNVMN